MGDGAGPSGRDAILTLIETHGDDSEALLALVDAEDWAGASALLVRLRPLLSAAGAADLAQAAHTLSLEVKRGARSLPRVDAFVAGFDGFLAEQAEQVFG